MNNPCCVYITLSLTFHPDPFHQIEKIRKLLFLVLILRRSPTIRWEIKAKKSLLLAIHFIEIELR